MNFVQLFPFLRNTFQTFFLFVSALRRSREDHLLSSLLSLLFSYTAVWLHIHKACTLSECKISKMKNISSEKKDISLSFLFDRLMLVSLQTQRHEEESRNVHTAALSNPRNTRFSFFQDIIVSVFGMQCTQLNICYSPSYKRSICCSAFESHHFSEIYAARQSSAKATLANLICSLWLNLVTNSVRGKSSLLSKDFFTSFLCCSGCNFHSISLQKPHGPKIAQCEAQQSKSCKGKTRLFRVLHLKKVPSR